MGSPPASPAERPLSGRRPVLRVRGHPEQASLGAPAGCDERAQLGDRRGVQRSSVQIRMVGTVYVRSAAWTRSSSNV